MSSTCLCGCGEAIKKGRSFVSGHNMRVPGYFHQRVYTPLTDAQKLKLSNIHKGRVKSEEHKRKIAEGLRGKAKSEDHKEKLSVSHKGKVLSEGHKSKISLAHSGCKNGFYGKNHSEITKETLRIKTTLLFANKENHPNWKGGLSFEPYSPEWDEKLKAKIKERDNHKCKNPTCIKTEIQLQVHHIDYNKKNCSEDNLITLCVSCHTKSNYNRGYWKSFYQNIIKEKPNGIGYRLSSKEFTRVGRKRRSQECIKI